MAKVREISIDELIQDERNLNRHTERGAELVGKSIGELGIGRSVLSDKNGKLIAGNLTTQKVKEAGIKKVIEVETEGDTLVVVKRKDLDLDSTEDNRARVLALADNSTASVSLDFDFEEVKVQEGEFGFDAGEWGLSYSEEETVIDAEDDNFNIPETIHTDIVPGDLFEFKKGGLCHRLLCGDSTNVDDWDKLMAAKIADLLLTDPPYGVKYVGKTKDALTIENDGLSADDTHQLWNEALTASLLNLKNGGSIYATVPAGLLQVGFMDVMLKHDCLRQCMVWDKGSLVLGHSDYHYEHEPILYGWKPGAAHYFTDDRTKTTVFRYKKPSRNDLHPTMKPIELWAEMINNSTKYGENIIDPFLGSGTTMVSAHQLERNCYGMELDPKYCQVIVDRMMELDSEITVTLNGAEYNQKAD